MSIRPANGIFPPEDADADEHTCFSWSSYRNQYP